MSKTTTCTNCTNTGAVSETYCACRAGARLRARHEHWGRLLVAYREETLARLDRVIAELHELPEGEVPGRVRRVLEAVALSDRARAALTRAGRRRSRKERAADALCTELLAQWRAYSDGFDALDHDMYTIVSSNERVQGHLLAVIAQDRA